MTHVLIDPEIVNSIGLSVVFVGIMLSIVLIGIIFFAYKTCSIACKTTKKFKKELIKMVLLIIGWCVFMFFNLQSSAIENYTQIFLWYSINHLFAIIIGSVVFLAFLIMLPKFWREYDKKLLAIAGIFAFLSIMERIIFPIFQNVYLGVINRIIVVIPALLGFFMIIKFIMKYYKK